jgi:hypothetical protein
MNAGFGARFFLAELLRIERAARFRPPPRFAALLLAPFFFDADLRAPPFFLAPFLPPFFVAIADVSA